MVYTELLQEVRRYIQDTFTMNSHLLFPYHSLNHTYRVVLHTKEISEHYYLNAEDTFIVLAAAWFHDIGYLSGDSRGHEQRGARLAATLLSEKQVNPAIITSIQECILVTCLPQKPLTLLQQIVCDADLYHFGTDEFFVQDELMRTEMELRTGNIDQKVWIKGTIHLLESHHFFTVYCQQLLNERKKLNLQKLNEKLRDSE